ncbi:uncharacterized protein LOC133531171 [Cydia pomonella]|uniref:uncharacterized protein LOC133531171 n=1 Tax=Cydia pomonella TaxID=82600 RepID=UPI002ADE546A|nr:uncharacterized protein LOC133531171 [Cydia pomonella]
MATRICWREAKHAVKWNDVIRLISVMPWLGKCCFTFSLRSGSIVIAILTILVPLLVYMVQKYDGFGGWRAVVIYTNVGIPAICSVLFLIFGIAQDMEWAKNTYAKILGIKIITDLIACAVLLIKIQGPAPGKLEPVGPWYNLIAIPISLTLYNLYCFLIVYDYSNCNEFYCE